MNNDKTDKQKLLDQAKIIGKLLYNGDLSPSEAVKALQNINKRLIELELSPDKFLYKGKSDD